MLKRLRLKNFTVFADADFEFVQGLNVLVGTNGTGKSHVLKAGYAASQALGSAEQRRRNNSEFNFELSLKFSLGETFYSVFLPNTLNNLVRSTAKTDAEIDADFGEEFGQTEGSLMLQVVYSEQPLNSTSCKCNLPAEDLVESLPVFIPAKEILTLSWILPAAKQLRAPIEKNHLDLLDQMRLLPLQEPEAAAAIEALTEIIGGAVREKGDEYFLVDKTGQRTAISMVAEGLRKFGTLQKLLANGSLTKQTTLYWDEPESNLNPALLRKLAAILAELARQGFQIILATHSTDLLKEFHILSRQKGAKDFKIKYFGLNAESGEAVRVVSTDNFEYLPDVVALEVELEQADELDAIFAREDRERHADL